ncbi:MULTISPECIES: RNA polymerase sigma factor [Eubacteriales]|uniref:RNA polymerase sigma factor, sigma-70 family n=1 Tax=Bittarella massiliensis (ex Durand et al. 2017) TaxID=1720313 RepID=A0AAQ1MC43_9FIRM|nr:MULTISPECIES: sigma-70 family RNA polymerase sigma factor [Eubacteriales]ERI99732.1 Sigma-70 region 2 [Clostridium sp. ATCC 29733]MZL70143.1 sigma-70 family RNA polymerase sigma factor [Bittarella massiliensis (ex Durand et al. 2017)]MZL81153.1 sigma-70 family RNA polymerase sigma factor [Bittarella massiliensis (ex Durand et al. 2017)]SHF83436.1 RNA polymerase sigma factor, sigma-70 family [Bittarella massiliensis (ex Durand et al. 2017)]
MFDLTVSHKQLGRWLKQVQQGDERAFAKLYAATVEAQYYQALALLGDPHLADDAVQDSYASLYKNTANIRDPQAVVAYLNRATYSCCQTILRRERRAPRAEGGVLSSHPDAAPGEGALDRRETSIALEQALRRLPERERIATIRFYCQQIPLRQIAQELGCSLATVKRSLASAKAKLRLYLKDSFALVPAGLALRWALPHSSQESARRAGLPHPPQRRISLPAAFACIALRDDGSGVDWASLHLTDSEGRPLPLEGADPASGEVYAGLPDGDYRLAVCDLAGNEAVLPFSVSPLL